MKTKALFGMTGAVIALFGVVGLATWLILPAAMTEAHAKSIEETAVTEQARKAVRAQFPLAEGVTFRQIYVNWVGEISVVCGHADIAHGQGITDGTERFTFIEGSLMIDELEGSEAVAQKWQDVCH